MRSVRNKLLKRQATRLRLQGYTFPMIESRLEVPRATLNSWFIGLELSHNAKQKLLERKRKNLEIVREKALVALRRMRLVAHDALFSKIQAELKGVEFNSLVKEFFLCGLYLGEGFKRRSTLGFGNSNPKILAAFVVLVRQIYQAEERRFRCVLHLRYDQNEEIERLYWSKQLNISEMLFRKTQFDKRTIGKKTWESYHGVCVVYFHDARVEKRLTILQSLLLEKVMGG